MEGEEPEFKFSISGILLLVFFFIFSLALVLAGYSYKMHGLTLWGYVFLMSSTLSLLLVLSRMFAYKAAVERLKRLEEQRLIEQRIKEKEKRKKENESNEI